jgi:hypothetical protein
MTGTEAFDEWFDVGLSMGWISEPYCLEHDTLPLREWEAAALEDGEEVCPLIVRLWHDGTEIEPRTLWEVFTNEDESTNDRDVDESSG